MALYRIYACRQGVLRCLPGNYETPEEAKFNFEKHRDDIEWCLIGGIDPYTRRPTFWLRGQVTAASQVEWRQVNSKRPG
jgi:hypothetical protein